MESSEISPKRIVVPSNPSPKGQVPLLGVKRFLAALHLAITTKPGETITGR